eukprot:Clim_evm90s210 gene=Clim_evmTU90s210
MTSKKSSFGTSLLKSNGTNGQRSESASRKLVPYRVEKVFVSEGKIISFDEHTDSIASQPDPGHPVFRWQTLAVLGAAVIFAPLVPIILVVMGFFGILAGSVMSLICTPYLPFYLMFAVKKPLVIGGKHSLVQTFKDRSYHLNRKYWPTFWLANMHPMTVFSIMRAYNYVDYVRESLKMPDGGQVCIDWYHNDEGSSYPNKTRPICLVLHGLTGGSGEQYVLNLVRVLAAQEFRVVVMNARGCGETELLTYRGFSASFTSDLRRIVSYIREEYPSAPLTAVGVSLGSMILTKYCGEEGSRCPFVAGMSISNPWDLKMSTESLESFPNKQTYNSRMASNLKRFLERHWPNLPEGHIPDHFPEYKHILQARTVREFDARVICPMFGYASTDEYYADASSVNWYDKIRIPYLFLNAADDVFGPVKGIPLKGIDANPYTMQVITARGGHVGFLQGLWPLRNASYMDDLCAEWMSCAVKNPTVVESSTGDSTPSLEGSVES